MARRFLQRYLPHPHAIRDHKHLRFFGRLLHDPNLLHLNQRSASRAFAVGLFWAFMPMPLQSIPAAATAILLRANLVISVALVWITNPLTLAPVYYFCYRIGTWILGVPLQELAFEPSWDWIQNEFTRVWQPFVLGCLIVSIASAVIGYYGMQTLWRWHVLRDWKQRKHKRSAKSKSVKE